MPTGHLFIQSTILQAKATKFKLVAFAYLGSYFCAYLNLK